jgi:hypothetical protein
VAQPQQETKSGSDDDDLPAWAKTFKVCARLTRAARTSP